MYRTFIFFKINMHFKYKVKLEFFQFLIFQKSSLNNNNDDDDLFLNL